MEITDKNSENSKKGKTDIWYIIFLIIFWGLGVFVWFKGWSNDDNLPWLQFVFGIPALMFLVISGWFFLNEIANDKKPKVLVLFLLIGLMSGALVVLFNLGFVINIGLLLIGVLVVGAIAYSWFSETSKDMKGLIKYLQFFLTFGFSYGVFYVILLFFTWSCVELFDFGNSFLKILTGVPINVVALIMFYGILIGGFITGVFAWYWANELTKPIIKKWLSSKYDQIYKKTGATSFTIPRRYVFLEEFTPQIMGVFAVVLTIAVFSLMIHIVDKIPHFGWRVEKMFDSQSNDNDY